MPNDGEMTAFEKYLAGEPLTPDLAALRRGEEAPGSPGEPLSPPAGLAALLEAFQPRRGPSEDDDRPLSREELLALKEAEQNGGIATLLKLLKKSLRAKIQLAIADSENDPLGRGIEISRGWAYIAVYRRMISEMQGFVKAALNDLERQERERA